MHDEQFQRISLVGTHKKIHIKKTAIPTSNSVVKYLCMRLDKKLTWKHHIQMKANKNKEIYVLVYGKAIPIKS